VHVKKAPASESAPGTRVTWIIASATGVGTMSIYLWYPFLPLFLLTIGVQTEADAAFWVAAGMAGQGVGRILGGPLWGALSDRVGRKKMFIRAAASAGFITLFLGWIQQPWHLVGIMFLHGAFSGFNPAAVALASVSVPENRVRWALSMASGGQYIGTAVGPAIGALLAVLVGFRGATLISGVMVIAVAAMVYFKVPADRTGAALSGGVDKPSGANSSASLRVEVFRFSLQLGLAILIYFTIFSLNNFRAVATPIALRQLDSEQAIAMTGLAFSLVGVASALGVLLAASSLVRRLRLRTVLAVATFLTGIAFAAMGASNSVPVFVLALAVGSLLNASMFPATNTLIALNTAKARRGTAFGVASSAQALGFVAGPAAAALFAASSLSAGFIGVGVLLVVFAGLIATFVKEPPGSLPPVGR
jgi:DHA1 family multidrug resistance protein-like MFS transporter